ncbi:MAG TPA: signal peptidase I [Planctomycetes bacterium]|nr:signal peptidase I [Planctomycetota bacterium]
MKGEKRPWRENIEAMTMAVVMALFLKGFIIEAYKIPTGSMQPTLIGDERSGIEDRILVDKLSYVLGDPQRWDVAVFRYPLDRSQNFVKRVVGIGPEELKIENGDLWHRPDGDRPWEILRRPKAVQGATWKRLDLSDPPVSSWGPPRGETRGAAWEYEGRTIRARGPGRTAFRPKNSSIMDHYLDGYPEAVLPYMESRRGRRGFDGFHAVGDLRLDGTVRPDGAVQEIRLGLREGLRHYVFHLPGPAANADAKPRIEVRLDGRLPWPGQDPPPTIETPSPRRLDAGRETRFAVQNIDDRLSLELDGDPLLTLDIPPASDQSSSVSIELDGPGDARCDFEDLMVYRDIYYLSEGRWLVTIPEGSYYMLGDNTQDSSDSRAWHYLRYSVTEGGGGERILRGNDRGNENPRVFGYGDEDGTKLLLVDEYGERHIFHQRNSRKLPPENAPFVPREMFQGKALAVFWPLDPLRHLVRLKWIH